MRFKRRWVVIESKPKHSQKDNIKERTVRGRRKENDKTKCLTGEYSTNHINGIVFRARRTLSKHDQRLKDQKEKEVKNTNFLNVENIKNKTIDQTQMPWKPPTTIVVIKSGTTTIDSIETCSYP